MVDITESIGSLFAGTGAGILGGAQKIIWVLLIGAALYGVVWWYLEQKKYNKTVIVMRLGTDNKKKYLFDKAKYYKDKNGVDGWQIKGLKRKVDVPPDEAIDFSVTGSTVASCVLDSSGQITWMSQNLSYDDIKKSKVYEPISSQSKANYAYQLDFNKRLNSSLWKDNMPMMIGGITLVMILAVVLFFLPKTMDASAENSRAQADAAAKIGVAIEQLDDLWTGQQRILAQQPTQPSANDGVVVTEGEAT